MDNDQVIPSEQELVESIDWDNRLWPRAIDTGEVPGEWELTIRGSEEEFIEIHILLVREGFLVNQAGDYDVYARRKSGEV